VSLLRYKKTACPEATGTGKRKNLNK